MRFEPFSSLAIMTPLLVLLTLTLTLTGVKGQQNSTIEFSHTEEFAIGTFLGLIADKPEITDRVPQDSIHQLRYRILPGHSGSDYYTINENTGMVVVARRVDREAVCPGQEDTCVLDFPVAVSASNLKFLVNVKVNIVDVNDNGPIFPRARLNLEILEDKKDIIIPLPSAVDADVSSTITYELINPSPTFTLEQSQGPNGTTQLRLVSQGPLDREYISRYLFKVVATDSMRITSLTVDIQVLDVNDNAPMFALSNFQALLSENSPVGTQFLTVHAIDSDEGINASLVYSLNSEPGKNTPELLHKVRLDRSSGVLTLMGSLSVGQYTLYIQVTDQGIPALSSQATVLITVEPSQ